jgi:hypothetical protein
LNFGSSAFAMGIEPSSRKTIKAATRRKVVMTGLPELSHAQFGTTGR